MDLRFDTSLQCWTLHRYSDVHAAFRDSRFAISPAPFDEASHTWALRNAMNALTPERIAEWKLEIEALPFEYGGDLVRDLAEPWSHAAALRLVGLRQDPGLLTLTRAAFAAGADPFDDALKARGDAANVELSRVLPDALGPVTVQAFVAVSQTLSAFLAGAWLALLQRPAQLTLLRSGEAPLTRAIEELLRFAGPSQVQFRYAGASIEGKASEGSRIALLTGEANRDPDQFGADADVLNLERNASGHLAFGFGMHACIGAALMRTAASVAISRFVECSGDLRLADAKWPEPARRFAIRAPLSIHVYRRTNE